MFHAVSQALQSFTMSADLAQSDIGVHGKTSQLDSEGYSKHQITHLEGTETGVVADLSIVGSDITHASDDWKLSSIASVPDLESSKYSGIEGEKRLHKSDGLVGVHCCYALLNLSSFEPAQVCAYMCCCL
jgi:hypothetical protein